jgi:hypothetical protein
MNGIILLDGPDCVGKSTLQDAILKLPDTVGMHLTYPVPPQWRDMWDYMTECMMHAIRSSTDKLVVVDRHWISEGIYAQVFRGGSPWPHMGRMMDRVWMKHAAVTVLCLPSNLDAQVTFHAQHKDPSHPYDDGKYRELCQRYLDFYGGGGPTYDSSSYVNNITRVGGAWRRHDFMRYRIDVEGVHRDSFIERVLTRLHFQRENQYEPALRPDCYNILGHKARARVLLVGEQCNVKDNWWPAWPFFEHTNSSLFLAQQMAAYNIPEDNLMWTNALDQAGAFSQHIKPLAQHMRVVALGNKVQGILNKQGVRVDAVVPHPQYARRFPHKVKNYPNQLWEAINGNTAQN